LESPDPRFVGERLGRSSPRYAVRALRAAFTWLVDVRCLSGNPWKAVNDPKIVQRETAMQIHRALPADLWRRLRNELDRRADEEGDKFIVVYAFRKRSLRLSTSLV
jgi:hypothetical protein